jgi:hypothetical protein
MLIMDNKMGERLALLMFALLLIASGCSDDDPVTPDPPGEWQSQLPFPDNPMQMMANFLAAHDAMDLLEYQNLLHPDFEMFLNQETTDLFPDLGATIDYTDEMRVSGRMFGGEDLTDPLGAMVPGIKKIDFLVLSPLDAWQPVVNKPVSPGTHWAPYNVVMIIDRGQEYSLLRVEGQVPFYATVQDSLHDGEMQPFYRLSGQIDLGLKGQASERFSWGHAKALYR